jgi:hypothetical protein
MYPSIPSGRLPSFEFARGLAPLLADAAAKVHSLWDQDADGFDEELGAGGICQDVASAMSSVLSEAGIDAMTMHASVGENHVFLVAPLEDGVYAIDIPPDVYETGGGYVWRKRHDAVFTPNDVQFDRIADPMSPDEFEEAYGF